ncbi:RES family NAD+ phosphorylase [Edaphobacter aggregans]|uniref:RES family NAD+ phosphorylase n=1 Tax=Edaphobacter aggregans TaxID=570835 RepID=UPI00055479BF|nr:RES family NAD+ phosphorylase [Edaphobacter aggregans]
MTLVYRLLRQPFADMPFDGEGSYRYGGRWSHPGTRMVYTAEHLSLAMLEYLAHLDPDRLPTDLVLAQAEIPDDISRVQFRAEDLPLDWRTYPAPTTLKDLGSEFVKESKAAVMIVPSVLATVENNWLINPVHPDFQRIKIVRTEPFQYDTRLVRV